MSGIFGAKRCEICEITSCINGWFFIVLRAFIILCDHLSDHEDERVVSQDIPDDGRLDDVFTILVNSF
jgi:hypothetical protein